MWESQGTSWLRSLEGFMLRSDWLGPEVLQVVAWLVILLFYTCKILYSWDPPVATSNSGQNVVALEFKDFSAFGIGSLPIPLQNIPGYYKMSSDFYPKQRVALEPSYVIGTCLPELKRDSYHILPWRRSSWGWETSGRLLEVLPPPRSLFVMNRSSTCTSPYM